MARRETGLLGEKLAKDFLSRKGYKILETNYRCHYGEMDIVARKKDYLVFIEVKTRSGNQFGTPEESITATKMEHLRAVAEHYRQNHEKLPASWRIDMVAVELDRNRKPLRIEVVENAVGGE